MSWDRSVIIVSSTRIGFVFANVSRQNLEPSDVEVRNLWSLYFSPIIRFHFAAVNCGHFSTVIVTKQVSAAVQFWACTQTLLASFQILTDSPVTDYPYHRSRFSSPACPKYSVHFTTFSSYNTGGCNIFLCNLLLSVVFVSHKNCTVSQPRKRTVRD